MPAFCPQRRRRMTWSGKPGWWSSGWGWRRRGTPCWCLRRAAGSPGRLPTGESPFLLVAWGRSGELPAGIVTENVKYYKLPREGPPSPNAPVLLVLACCNHHPLTGSQRSFIAGQESDTMLLSSPEWAPRTWLPNLQKFSLLLSRSVVSDSLRPHWLQHARLPILHHLPELAQTHVHWVSDAIQSSRPLSSPSPPPSVFSRSRVFCNESVLHIRWQKYWSFSISHSNEYSGRISFRIDWLDPLDVQGTLKSLLQHHSSKASILRRSAFFMVQLSYPYMIAGTTIALTRWTFVNKVTSLLFNTLSRFVLAFLPRSKCLVITQMQSRNSYILT